MAYNGDHCLTETRFTICPGGRCSIETRFTEYNGDYYSTETRLPVYAEGISSIETRFTEYNCVDHGSIKNNRKEFMRIHDSIENQKRFMAGPCHQ
jgi:hypothetical protein